MKKHLSERKRFSIMTDDLESCIICGTNYSVQKHEVFYGKSRQQSIDNGLVIPLCVNHHNKIHNDTNLDREWKKCVQVKFEEKFSHDEFMKLIKRNYL